MTEDKVESRKWSQELYAIAHCASESDMAHQLTLFLQEFANDLQAARPSVPAQDAREWLDKEFPPKTEILKGLTTFDERHFREERRQLAEIMTRWVASRSEVQPPPADFRGRSEETIKAYRERHPQAGAPAAGSAERQKNV